MIFYQNYASPLGTLILTSDGETITGLWFSDQKGCPDWKNKGYQRKSLPVFQEAQQWLDQYFSGVVPKSQPPLKVCGTAFQMAVFAILQTIPYGETVTYGEIAKQYARKTGISRMSSQAVGGAVGSNPISLMIPCHRVIGVNGNLTGYAGGIHRKEKLLLLEKASMQK